MSTIEQRLPRPYYDEDGITIYHGNSADILPHLSGIDACVTDPPYGLSFMGKAWDYDVPTAALWAAVLAALKPGAHLLAFAGTRTQHRMAVNIEDAGFEIRDMIAWVYGQGFPKSLDVSKAIDKAGGAAKAHLSHRLSLAAEIREKRRIAGVSAKELAAWFPQYAAVTANWERTDAGFRVPSEDAYSVLVDRLGIRDDWRDMVRAEDLRRAQGGLQDRRGDGSVFGLAHKGVHYSATTDAAKQWHGWGTALKPALEPITMARKPLIGTVAENVLTHGTGAINVDGCRIETSENLNGGAYAKNPTARSEMWGEDAGNSYRRGGAGDFVQPTGRFPANLIHDGSEEVTGLFPGDGDKSAARFFYQAKASKSDRGAGNVHPTVKPLDLMCYLVRLVCRPGGIVLDPFMGSGTTILAARSLGMRAIGIEREEKYCEIAVRRLAQQTMPQTDTNNQDKNNAPT
jgi:DNA modification methylase